MDFHKVVMAGKLFLQSLSSTPSWSSSDERRIIYNSSDGLLYYADDTQWKALALNADLDEAGTKQTLLEEWNPDDEKVGLHTSNLWNTTPTIGFSPLDDGGIWTTFRMRDNWQTDEDILFKIEYAMSATSSENVVLKAEIWILSDGETVDEDTPDITATETINPPSRNEKDTRTCTSIKISSSNFSSTDNSIVMFLYRDVNAVPLHNGWFEMIRMVAYQ